LPMLLLDLVRNLVHEWGTAPEAAPSTFGGAQGNKQKVSPAQGD